MYIFTPQKREALQTRKKKCGVMHKITWGLIREHSFKNKLKSKKKTKENDTNRFQNELLTTAMSKHFEDQHNPENPKRLTGVWCNWEWNPTLIPALSLMIVMVPIFLHFPKLHSEQAHGGHTAQTLT